MPGTGCFGSLWISIRPAGDIGPTDVELRLERAQRRQDVGVAEDRGLDDHERRAAGRVDDPAQRRDLLRHGRGPVAPGGEDLLGALDRPHQRAALQLLDGIELELDRGHDAELPAAAAQRPEQLGIAGARRRGRGGRRRSPARSRRRCCTRGRACGRASSARRRACSRRRRRRRPSRPAAPGRRPRPGRSRRPTRRRHARARGACRDRFARRACASC